MRLESIKNLKKIIEIIQRKENALAFSSLIILAFIIHHSAMNGFWRFDDGAHLKFVALYSPWQYFFIPSVMLEQSYAHITPYNVLFYEINLALFGMESRWYYAHQILILGATAFATYRLIRLWQDFIAALLAAILFLLGLPTLYVAQQLMTGHYSTGLLFSVISLYYFSLGIRQEKKKLIFGGALFYFLATLCKELYVPLVLLLPFIPVGDVKKRIKAALPFVVIAAFYMLWRYVVLGQLIGGYVATPVSLLDRFYQIASIPLLLLGWRPNLNKADYIMSHGSIHLLNILVILGLMVIANYRKRLNWIFIGTSFILIIIPLWPLAGHAINEANRYLFFVWWSCAVLIGVLSGSVKNMGRELLVKIASSISLCAILFFTQLSEFQQISLEISRYDTLSRTAVDMNNSTALIVPLRYGFILGARRAVDILRQQDDTQKSAKFILDKNSFCESVQKKFSILELNEECNCIKDVTHQWKMSLEKLLKYQAKSIPHVPLSVDMTFRDKWLQVDFGMYKDGIDFIFLGEEPIHFPKNFRIRWPGNKALHFRIARQSPDGSLAVSPILEFDMTKNAEFHWEGVSIVERVSCEFETK